MPDGSGWPKATYEIGKHKIITGDCIKVMAAMEAASVDVVVTSPPYNLNLAYGVYDDSKTEQDYIEWLAKIGGAIRRVLRSDGSFFLNIAGSNSRPWIPFAVAVELRKHFELQNHIIWIKSIGIGSASSGHFKPIPGKRFMHHNHEHIFHFSLSNNAELNRLSIGIPFQDKSNINRRGHERDLRCRGNTWFIPYKTVRSKAQKFFHPGTFPVELPLWCIYLHGRRPATVLDPFLGTGTSLIAAHLAGARGIGIDIDATYVETARVRLSETVEGSLRIVLNQIEMDDLFRQDEAERDTGGFQGKLVYFQTRMDKSMGELPLVDEDLEWIRRNGSHPEKGGWQRRVRRIFLRTLGERFGWTAET